MSDLLTIRIPYRCAGDGIETLNTTTTTPVSGDTMAWLIQRNACRESIIWLLHSPYRSCADAYHGIIDPRYLAFAWGDLLCRYFEERWLVLQRLFMIYVAAASDKHPGDKALAVAYSRYSVPVAVGSLLPPSRFANLVHVATARATVAEHRNMCDEWRKQFPKYEGACP